MGEVFRLVGDVFAHERQPRGADVRADDARIPRLADAGNALHGGIGIHDLRLRQIIGDEPAALQDGLFVRIQAANLRKLRPLFGDQAVLDLQHILAHGVQVCVRIQEV